MGLVEVVVVTAPTTPLVFATVTRVVVDVLLEEAEDARLPMLTVTGVARLPSSSCTFSSCSSAPVAGFDKVVPDASFRRQRLCRASCCCCRPLCSSALHAMLISRTSRIDRRSRAMFQHFGAQKRVWERECCEVYAGALRDREASLGRGSSSSISSIGCAMRPDIIQGWFGTFELHSCRASEVVGSRVRSFASRADRKKRL